jgi:UDP-2,4-diacetamido-2,4,6-trideoxy-beta-L-altropyranose hydrolase
MHNVFLICADHGADIGFGHIMRCLALAQALRERGGKVVFALKDGAAGFIPRLASEDFGVTVLGEQDEVVPPAAAAAEAAKIGANWIVVDGYRFSSEHRKILRESGSRLCEVDDDGLRGPYVGDIVLNQNAYADEDLYPDLSSSVNLLLGTRYALLRREFKPKRNWQRQAISEPRHFLITFGGEDTFNLSERALHALQLLGRRGLEALVVVGRGNPHRSALEAAAARSGVAVRLEYDVIDMSGPMAWADGAISAAGSTCWELAFMQLPGILVSVATNQSRVAEICARQGLMLHAGWHEEVSTEMLAGQIQRLCDSQELRSSMIRAGRRAVDGRGADRVALALTSPVVRMCPAAADDTELLWTWRNDPVVRSQSFSSERIGWEEHTRWFEKRLEDPTCCIYIGRDEALKPVGQVRVQRIAAREAEVHISVDAGSRGLGYAASMLLAVARQLLRKDETDILHAFIKPENAGSLRAFEAAGYQDCGSQMAGAYLARHFVCNIQDSLA